MKRGLAIAIVYFALILTPFALIGLLVPPIVTQANNLVNNLPDYAQQFTDFVNNNDQLRKLQQDYDLTGKLRGAGAEAAPASSATRPACSATSASASSTRSSPR